MSQIEIISSRNATRQAYFRRTLFILALLGTGSAVSALTGAYAYDRGHPYSLIVQHPWQLSFQAIYRQVTGLPGIWFWSLFPLNAAYYFDAILWGADSTMVILLAAWLSLRTGWWRNWGGRLRVATYMIAFNYGSMLTTTTQRYLNDITPNGYTRYANGPNGLYVDYQSKFHYPGTQINSYYNDYSRPATDLLLMLISLCVLVPLSNVFRFSLGGCNPDSRISVRSIMIWTALVASTMAYAQFLCSWVSPDTGYSNMPFSNAIAECLFQLLPATTFLILALLIVRCNPIHSPWLTVSFCIVILTFDIFANTYLFSSLSQFTGRENPLANPARIAFQLGRLLTLWIGFALAAKLGVQLTLMPKQARS